MSTVHSDLCGHCRLPIGVWPHDQEIEGERRRFCCYGCFIGWQAANGGGDDATATGFLIRLGVGAFLAMNIMLFSLLLYTGALDRTDPDMVPRIHLVLWLLATPVLVILGGPFFKETVMELCAGRFAPSLLIVLGSSAAYLHSTIATMQGSDRVYFDTVTMVLVLFTLGRYLEANGRARATRSLRPMLDAERTQVRVVEGEAEKLVRLNRVVPGMLVRVLPGERIPVDGVVRSGVSQAECAALTGESLPVTVKPGSLVMAGSVNCDGSLLLEATKNGLSSDWVAICRDVRQALARPSQAERLADTAARTFVPIVATIAVGVFLLGWHQGTTDTAFMSALAVLVVACPCALGLAAPLATSLALADLAEHGIVVRSSAALEALSAIRSVALDKTGTLTRDHISCLKIVAANSSPDLVLNRAAAVAANSLHPLSKAIRAMASERNIHVAAAKSPDAVPGEGVCGVVAGAMTWVGSRRWLESERMSLAENLKQEAADAARMGHMVAFVAWQKKARALLVFSNEAHPDARLVIRALEGRGLKTVILTGDGPQQTKQFCEAIGVKQWFAKLSPHNKQTVIRDLSDEEGPVAMVGDGINDAPALTSAAVGIAVRGGTALARETADVVLPEDRIALLPQLFSTAAAVKRKIATNLFWAFSYNGVAIALAAVGLLQPVIAAALMAGSSLFVVMNSFVRGSARQDSRVPMPVTGSSQLSSVMDHAIE